MKSKRHEHLLEIVENFQHKHILVIGDVMLDEYLAGSVNRVSPEAPVPVVLLNSRTSKPGGAANVALNVKALGAQVSLVGLKGNDEAGQQLDEALKEAGILPEYLVPSSSRRTTRKARVMSEGQQLLRVDTEDLEPTNDLEEKLLIQSVRAVFKKETIDAILFQDYDKGVLGKTFINEVVTLAKGTNTPTVVDPKARNFWDYQGVDIFKPNLKEISEALPHLHIDARSDQSLQTAHIALKEKLKHQISLITLGGLGAVLISDNVFLRLEAHPRKITDVCGAGDSVISVAALAKAINCDVKDVLELSNLAGGLTCEYVGVHPINKKDMQRGILGITSFTF